MIHIEQLGSLVQTNEGNMESMLTSYIIPFVIIKFLTVYFMRNKVHFHNSESS